MRLLCLVVVALFLQYAKTHLLAPIDHRHSTTRKKGIRCCHRETDFNRRDPDSLFGSAEAFSTSSLVMENVVKKTQNPVLHREEANTISSGMEHLFDRLYRNDFDMARLPSTEKYHEIEPLDDDSSPLSRRVHFLIQVAYLGEHFCGWQRQPDNALSVQQTLEECLKHYPSIRKQGEGVNLRVCGRTDAGVHAIGQVCRFRTRVPFDEADLFQHLSQLNELQEELRVISVRRVSLRFHPTNTCKCRAYTYLLNCDDNVTAKHMEKLNFMLKELEGKELNYYGVSYGAISKKKGNCTMFHSRACFVNDISNGRKAVCVELVGNRFLRRMVRILVATALHLMFLPETTPLSLYELILMQDRRLGSTAAPPEGLIFVSAMFNEI